MTFGVHKWADVLPSERAALRLEFAFHFCVLASYIFQGGCHAATAIVTLTHDPRLDDLTLLEAVRTPAFYIGAIGSQHTSAWKGANE